MWTNQLLIIAQNLFEKVAYSLRWVVIGSLTCCLKNDWHSNAYTGGKDVALVYRKHFSIVARGILTLCETAGRFALHSIMAVSFGW